MVVLVITGMDDVHADVVIPLLEQQGSAVVRLNTDNFAENASYQLSSNGWGGEVSLADSARSFNLEHVSAVWYRKPVPIHSQRELAFVAAHDFASVEFEALLRSLMGLLSNAFWLSDYWRIRTASQKLPNLRVAAELGLKVPNTIVTNRADDARRFAEGCDWQLLAKPFALTTFKPQPNTNTSWDSFATVVDQNTFDKLAPSLPLAPVILQEYVKKHLELRVTIVGRKVFCASIDSQQHAFAQHDWRAVDSEELTHNEFALPPSLQQKLLAFNEYFGLEFSTHDLIINKAGDFIWLECNPNGQWLWIEHLTGQPIAQSIADLLANPADRRLCGY